MLYILYFVKPAAINLQNEAWEPSDFSPRRASRMKAKALLPSVQKTPMRKQFC